MSECRCTRVTGIRGVDRFMVVSIFEVLIVLLIVFIDVEIVLFVSGVFEFRIFVSFFDLG